MSDRCDNEIYSDGEVVFVTNTIRTPRMEEWVQKIAKDSGQRVDWHQFAGRPVIKALGDLSKVRKAIADNRNMHDEYYAEACAELRSLGFSKEDTDRHCQGIWDYNRREYGL